MKDEEKFEVHTFDQLDDSKTEAVESDLTFADALVLATEVWNKGRFFGVEIISSDPDNMEPIVWVRSRYAKENPTLPK